VYIQRRPRNDRDEQNTQKILMGMASQ
jgi:hypothetical protein